MKGNIIKIKPDENGDLYIKFYGEKYQIVIEKPVKKK